MTSTKKKGDYYERKSKKDLEEIGYKVERALSKVVWIKGRPICMHHDFFGLFDLIAVQQGKIPRFIQVKFKGEKRSIAGLVKLKKDLSEFPKEVSAELWIWYKEGRRAFVNIEILNQGDEK